VTVGDAIQLEYGAQDVAYFDPPYTKRQYAAYYHIPETIALGDAPEVGGVTGLRPWKHLASDYCYRTRARSALRELIETCPADRILLSYSNEGHVTRDDVEAVLEGHGDVVVHTVGSIGRYRPNKGAATRGSHVEEYVFEVLRADAPTEAVA
jgi:adenine-specific DNA-methyltransferase